MFSSRERLAKRTPNNGIDRESYIQLLAEEYYETTDLEAKIQVTANLANFAYDPINYAHLLRAAVPKLFVELLEAAESRLVLNGIAGLCNCCLDPTIRHQLLTASPDASNNTIDTIAALLLHSNTDIVINTLTTLIQLHAGAQRHDDCCRLICRPATVGLIRRRLQTAQVDERLRSLATIFIEDFASHADDAAAPE